MGNANDMTYDSFKREICTRCETLYELRRRESVLNKVLEKYPDESNESGEMELKYPLGTESVKEIFKQGCTYVSKCDEVIEMIDKVSELEEKISKLMYYLMVNNNEKEVYYISSDIDPFYSVLSNRIVRCNRAKESVLKDVYDTKKFIDKFNNR